MVPGFFNASLRTVPMAPSLTSPVTFTLPQALAVLRESIISSAADGWQRVEVALDPLDIKSFLETQDMHPLVYWQDRSGLQETGGLGMAHEIRMAAQDFKECDAALRPVLAAGAPGARYFGGSSFAQVCRGREWQGFPAVWFILARLEINRHGQRMSLAVNFFNDGPGKEDRRAALRALDGIRQDFVPAAAPSVTVARERDLPQRAAWADAVQRTLEAIGEGVITKLVLARRTDLSLSAACHPLEILRAYQKVTPGCYHFLFQPSAGEAFFGASFERLFKRSGTRLWTEAVAGTRPRGASDAEDRVFAAELLNDPKERLEHHHVIDAIRESLLPLRQQSTVDELPVVEKFRDSQHLVSRFTCVLAADTTDGNILERLHPTPAVAGTPTPAALERIAAAEAFHRGWYAGPVGWIGRDEAEFAVAIRSGLVRGRELSVFAGAGIVAGSDPHREWAEVELKISNILKALS